MARDIYPPPLSKTAKYKKITKPLLERKRRARINRCLDELKDLMVGALEIDDDNMSKLEKADILELTVGHLTRLHGPRDATLDAQRFQAGFGQCAAEACRFILALPDLDVDVSRSLVGHLSRLASAQPAGARAVPGPTYSPPVSPPSPETFRSDDRSSSDGERDPYDDRYPDDVSQYSASSSRSRPEQASPPPGLLTTVDRARSPPRRPEPYPAAERPRRSNYFDRVPAECKDVILQKIRQHIMEKRGIEVGGAEAVHGRVVEGRVLEGRVLEGRVLEGRVLEGRVLDGRVLEGRVLEEYAPRVSVKQEPPRDHAAAYGQGADTLDLRKIRTPSKMSPEKRRYNDSPPAVHRSVAPPPPQVSSEMLRNPQIASEPPARDERGPMASVPEQLAMDYSNLPPKKKRKLLEYQEYKKQEESRRLDEIANRQRNEYLLVNGHPEHGEYDANNPAWRPW